MIDNNATLCDLTKYLKRKGYTCVNIKSQKQRSMIPDFDKIMKLVKLYDGIFFFKDGFKRGYYDICEFIDMHNNILITLYYDDVCVIGKQWIVNCTTCISDIFKDKDNKLYVLEYVRDITDNIVIGDNKIFRKDFLYWWVKDK